MSQPLPDGFRVTLDPKTLHLKADRLLVGGSPLTALRLSSAAAAHLVDDQVTVSDQASAKLADRLVATNLARPALASLPPVLPTEMTVVVPVRDRPEQLDRCLGALHPLPVIVVDDASHDPASVEAVAQRHRATLVSLDRNVGPAAARNAGLMRVTTPVVAFVDSDVEATSDTLLELARHLADPAVVLVGPRVVGHVRSVRPRWFEQYDAAASSLTLGTTPNTVRPGAAVAWLPSACLVARTESLGDGFDAALRVGEDVDLVWRLVASGHRVRYEPDVAVRHDVRPTIRGWLGRKFVYGSGGAVLAARHGSNVAPAVLSPTMALAGAAVLLRRRWSLPVAFGALVVSTRSVERVLPSSVAAHTRARVAVRIGLRGIGWSVRQQSALLLRHWWPAAALGCVASASVRRAFATALVVDSCIALAERDQSAPPLPALLVGRRLDDLAYGAGLWWGAARARSLGALSPRRPGTRVS
ncbi:mycofactocin biosynthesis glycosyltransferase MftF [soil metagenome]